MRPGGGFGVIASGAMSPELLAAEIAAKAQPVGSFSPDDAPIDIRDINIPRLNLVQKIGDLQTKFDVADIGFSAP